MKPNTNAICMQCGRLVIAVVEINHAPKVVNKSTGENLVIILDAEPELKLVYLDGQWTSIEVYELHKCRPIVTKQFPIIGMLNFPKPILN